MLSKQALTLNEVAEHFDISRPAISKHIKILTECGLVIIRPQGRERYCQPDLKQLQQVAEWTTGFQAFWTQKMDALQIFLEAGLSKNKSKKNFTPKNRKK